jgi:hypothetical protein
MMHYSMHRIIPLQKQLLVYLSKDSVLSRHTAIQILGVLVGNGLELYDKGTPFTMSITSHH